MRAVQLVEIGAGVENRDVDLSAPGSREVVVKVTAAGICHSDAHYRSGASQVGPLPLTLGHEVAGEVAEIGSEVRDLRVGDRVCLHYLLSCGDCTYCRRGREQFCREGGMIGKHVHGGWAEHIVVPARCAIRVPAGIPSEHAAVLMCSTATAYHALTVCRLRPGERIAVMGVGGLGLSAVQLALAMGAEVFAIDRNPDKLDLAAYYGASVMDARSVSVSQALRDSTGGDGVDVAIDFTGSPEVMTHGLDSLAPFGRLGLAAITSLPFAVQTYSRLIGGELSVIGVSDHLASELPELLRWVSRGALDLTRIASDTVALEAKEINEVLDRLDRGSAPARTVVIPG
jgi:propanol-preferring alcohol dehydrogenase